MTGDAHWIYIAVAYGATFAILGVVIWRVASEHSRLLQQLAQLQGDEGDDA